MPYITPNVIEKAREIDLLTYLRTCEPGELVRISPNNYTTKTHDSLKISNGKWMWWSHQFGGYSALDYLIKVRGYSFTEAVEMLVGRDAARMPANEKKSPTVKSKKVLLLPSKSETHDVITEYLISRGIDEEIINYCIVNDLIFESLPYHNLVCIGYDDKHKPRYAAYRATTKQRLMGDCSGSDKHYSFRIVGKKSDEVHIFESAIDLLSYATLSKMMGNDWRDDNLLSLAGVYLPKTKLEESKVPVAIDKYLGSEKAIEKIFLHLDNDATGRRAALAFKTILSNKYEVIDKPPSKGKDYNDFLRFRIRTLLKKTRERDER